MERINQIAEGLALLRLGVGALGEDTGLNWWRSGFCGSAAEAYLAPVFPKTVGRAILSGITVAAGRVHDEHIGVGRVFHLFRLPAAYEQAIGEAIGRLPTSRIREIKASPDAAREFLRTFADGCKDCAEGPVQIGKSDELSHPSVWKKVAAVYLSASEASVRVYPYFVEK